MGAVSWQLAWRSFTALLYYLTYPLLVLAKAALLILATLSSPFVCIGKTLLGWSLAPFRLFAPYKDIFIYYLAWAPVVGVVVGFLVFTIFSTFDEASRPSNHYARVKLSQRKRSQTLDSRWDRQWKEAISRQGSSQLHDDYFGAVPIKETAPLINPYADWGGPKAGFLSSKDPALISTTILEEEEEEEEDSHDPDEK